MREREIEKRERESKRAEERVDEREGECKTRPGRERRRARKREKRRECKREGEKERGRKLKEKEREKRKKGLREGAHSQAVGPGEAPSTGGRQRRRPAKGEEGVVSLVVEGREGDSGRGGFKSRRGFGMVEFARGERSVKVVVDVVVMVMKKMEIMMMGVG